MQGNVSASSSGEFSVFSFARKLSDAEITSIYRAFRQNPEPGHGSFFIDAPRDGVLAMSWLGVGRILDDDELRDELKQKIPLSAPNPQIPGEFTGGLIGWANYDSWATQARSERAQFPDSPGRWMRASYFIVQDHLENKSFLVSCQKQDAAQIAHGLLASIRLEQPEDTVFAEPELKLVPDDNREIAEAAISAAQYEEQIEQCRSQIAAGNAYQLCLTTSFSGKRTRDCFEIFLDLRAGALTSRGGLIEIGEAALISASPEQFLFVDRGLIYSEPIKGTRARMADPEADLTASDELLSNVKERAENVMIVDLMRNDFAKVAETGSVQVPILLEVASYPTVHQLYSRVSARLREGTTWEQLLLACFPAGSMTGAPKAAAIDILRGLETASRGVYAGCFGMISDHGFADLRMVIRTIFIARDSWSLGAGGGIMWLSDAREECAEVALKAQFPLSVLGAQLPADWRATLPGMVG